MCLFAVYTLAALPAHAQDLPARVGKVNDFAEVLDAIDRADLERQLAALERDTSVDVAVVTLRTLGGRGADEYARRFFDTWGIGRTGRANGVLLLLAVQDHDLWVDGGEGGGPFKRVIPNWRGSLIRDLASGPCGLGANDSYGNVVRKCTYQLIALVRLYENFKVSQRNSAIVYCILVGLAAFALGTAAGAKVVVPLILAATATVGLLCVSTLALYLNTVALPPVLLAPALPAVGMIALGFILGRRPRWRRRLRGRDGDGAPWIAGIGRGLRYVLQLAAVGAAYLVPINLISILRTFGVDVAPFAPSFTAGVAAGALLVLGARMWPAIAAASLFFYVHAGLTEGLSVLYWAPYALLRPIVGVVGALTFWWLAKRYADGLKTFSRVDAVARFVACALVAAAVYLTIGFFVILVNRGIQGVAPPINASGWLSGFIDTFLGIIIVTPVITLWATGGPWRWTAQRGLEFAAVLVVTAVSGWFVFGDSAAGSNQYPIPFLVLPVLLWPAFRFGPRETVTTTLLLSLIAMTGSAMGLGPFARDSVGESLFLVQLFLAVCALGALAVAAEVGRREASEAEVRRLNEDLEHRASVRAQELVRAHARLRRARVKHAAAMRHVHARIASDLHDSVGASLSRIAILSDLALRESEASATLTTGALTKIGDNARAVIDEMSDAVWFVDPKMEDIQQMVVRLRSVAGGLFESNGTHWEIDAAPELLPLTLTTDQRRHLFLILKEALTNVHRHAHATVVQVVITATDSGLRAVVDDNGTGMVAAHTGPGHGNGLTNMQKRARELAGALSIQSRPAIDGTRIIVDIPLQS